MAEAKNTKKVETKKAGPVVNPVAVVTEEAKPVNPNITCNHCGYTVARLNNEALVGVNCTRCNKNGKLL